MHDQSQKNSKKESSGNRRAYKSYIFRLLAVNPP